MGLAYGKPLLQDSTFSAKHHTSEEVDKLGKIYIGVSGSKWKQGLDKKHFKKLMILLDKPSFEPYFCDSWPKKSFDSVPGYHLVAFAYQVKLNFGQKKSALYQALDLDGNGSVNFAEFLYAADLAKSASVDGWSELLFRLFNKGKLDGELSDTAAKTLNDRFKDIAQAGMSYTNFVESVRKHETFCASVIGCVVPEGCVLVEGITRVFHPIPITAEQTVQELLEKIQDSLGSPGKHLLYFLPSGPEPLLYDRKLKDYNITPGQDNARVQMKLQFLEI